MLFPISGAGNKLPQKFSLKRQKSISAQTDYLSVGLLREVETITFLKIISKRELIQ